MTCNAEQSASEEGQTILTFAVHVQDETADGHGRIPAVLHQVVPIAIAALGDVLAECRQQLQRMARGKTRLGKRAPQGDRIGRRIGLPRRVSLERVEKRELVAFGQRGMIGSIVGCPGKPIECEYRRPKARSNQQRRDGKILIVLGFAGLELDAGAHRFSGRDCARPFHMPPRPRQCWYAESTVKTKYAAAINGNSGPPKRGGAIETQCGLKRYRHQAPSRNSEYVGRITPKNGK